MSSKGKGIATDKGKRKRDDDDKTGRRKRTNPSVLQFFEDSAHEVGDSDSGDISDFFDDDFWQEEVSTDIKVETEPGKIPHLPVFPKEEEMTEEELEKMLEERYKPGSSFVKYAEDARSSIERNTFMTAVIDPTIWKVKCTVGRERQSAFCLMQKYVDLQSLGTKLQIISAFAVDHVKGFIYIEADKQYDINEACKGICTIYSSRVAPVPVNEVSHLFSVRSKSSGISVDTWARVKNGKYKGDLAQVVAVNEAQRKVTVKLVPRIDLQALAEKFGGGVAGKRTATPAPRLISSSELEDFRPLIHCKRDRDTGKMFEVFDGMMLKDGYLFKKVSLDSLSFWGVMPSEDELLKFEPSKNDESADLEWLTGLFGEQKKKKTIKNDKGGGKGEGSSSSSMENSFEVHDLVFFGRKGFGVIIGREKDDSFKILKEGLESSAVVSLEPRVLKKAAFDKKFTALDQQKKAISINDTVRILEGPLEDKQGIVKQIYKGVIFLHDENEQENGGYFCSKAQICEKIELPSDIFDKKGGKSEASGFEDFSSSPKSPLSPQKPWQGRDSNQSFSREDKDGMFSVGQTLRIRVGPLKGYLCRVLAIRRLDVTVKLDSQHKILTVKSEHLCEVRAKSSGVSMGEELDSAKPFELLGAQDGSGGWMDGAASTAGGGWATGGASTERSSWAPFPASGFSVQPESSSATPLNSLDDDVKKDVGASAWDTKASPNQKSSWGAAVVEEKAVANSVPVGGWGNTGGSWDKTMSKPDFGGSGASSSWGKEKLSSDNKSGSLEVGGDNWGSTKSNPDNAAATLNNATGSWGKNNNASNTQDGRWKKPEEPWGKGKSVLGNSTSSWNNADAGKNPVDSWGKERDGASSQSTWGKAVVSLDDATGKGPKEDSWSKVAATSSKDGSSGSKSGWNSAPPESQTVSWGNLGGSSAKPNIEESRWQKGAGVGGNQREKWGSTKNDGEDAKGWGKSGSGNLSQSDTWSNPKASGPDGGSSWNKQDGGSSYDKQGGGSSWNRQDGGSSWNKQTGGSSWNKQSGGASWSNQANENTQNQFKGQAGQTDSWPRPKNFGGDRASGDWNKDRMGNQDGTDQQSSWGGRSNTYEGGRGSGGRRGRGGGHGGRDSFGRGRSFDRDQSSGWSRGQENYEMNDGSSTGNMSRWSGGQSGAWGNKKAFDGGNKNDMEGNGWKKGAGGNGDQTESWANNKKNEGEDAVGWGKSGSGGQGQWDSSNRTKASSADGQSGGGWDNKKVFDGGNKDDVGASGWKKSVGGTGDQTENWGSNKKKEGEDVGGWGKSVSGNQGPTGGWNKTKFSPDGGSSWNKQVGGSSWNKNNGGSSWGNRDGGSSWSKQSGGSSWGKQADGSTDDGGSSWSKQSGGSSWGKQADCSTDVEPKGKTDQSESWQRSNGGRGFGRFEGGRSSGGRRGRGGRGGRDNFGGGRSFDRDQSSSWSRGQNNHGASDGTSMGNLSSWSGQAGGWGNSKAFDGGNKDGGSRTSAAKASNNWNSGQAGGWGNTNAHEGKKDDAEASGWKRDAAAVGGQTGSWGNARKDVPDGTTGWGKGGNTNAHEGKKDDAEASGWKSGAAAAGGQTGSWGNAKKDVPDARKGWN